MQDEPIITRILVSLIQSKSICKLLSTLEQLDFQSHNNNLNKNDFVDNNYSVRTNRLSKRTIRSFELSDRWIN